MERLLRRADAAGGLHADPAGLVEEVADRLEHAEHDGQRRSRGDLAGRRLDEVGAACDRDERARGGPS